MKKGKEDQEGEELIPRIEPQEDQPSEKDFDLLPDRDLEYKENSNEKYRDKTKREE
ncbi:hypothetical protein [Planococcus sp. YIM B11945]|uniref:hypothetical protein n=1 Tax=Planococcus sp. YIM B11945 TaxID=3435410 RepID=UPI003D7E4733